MAEAPDPQTSPAVTAEILPTITAEVGAVPESRIEKAISAILSGIQMLESSECDLKTRNAVTDNSIRKSTKRLGELLTPAIYQNGKYYRFGPKWERLMYHVGETGDFRRSCVLAKVTEADAAKFFSSPKFLRFFDERIKMLAVRKGWSIDYFVSELDKVWHGKKIVTREQMDAIKEIGARVAPKIERIQHEFDSSEFEFTTREG